MANEQTEQKTGDQTQTQQTQNDTSTQTKTGDQSQQQQTSQQKPQFTYTEDRSKWIPDTRFKEVNTGYQTEKQKRETLERQLSEATTKIQALAGVKGTSPEELETEEVRAAFAKMFPGLAKLSDAQIEKLLKVAESGDRIEETTQNYWRNHGRQMIGKAEAQISDELGGQELTERQRKRIAREYIQYIEENAQDGALDRHESGDEKLVSEFTKQFLDDWRESIRKSVTNTELSRNRPVPSGRGRSVNTGGKKKIDYNDPKAVEDAMVESFRGHGGEFGN